MNNQTINTILKYATLICLFAVLLVPTVVSPSMFFLYITGKAYTFRIIVEIAFALWLVLAFRDRSYLPKRSWLFVAIAAFTVIVGIADVAGVEPLRSLSSNYERMEGFVFIAHLFLYFVVAAGIFGRKGPGELGELAGRRKLWGWFANASLFVALIVGVNGLSQLSGNPNARIDSFLGNSTYLGIYALIHLFIALYFWINALYKVRVSVNDPAHDAKSQGAGKWHTPSIIRLVGYSAIALFNFYVMYHTGTRGSLLGLAAGLTFIALVLAIFEKKHKVIRATGISIIGLIILSIALLGSFKNTDFVKGHNLLARFSEIATLDVKSVFENQGHARILLWNMAAKGVAENPVLGWGQDNFGYVFTKYYNPEMYNQESWFDRTHNVFFDWLISAGILGLLSYLSLYFFALWYIWKNTLSLAEKSVITGLLIAHFVHNLFVFDNLSSYIAFFSVLAFVHSVRAEKPLLVGKAGVAESSAVASDAPLLEKTVVEYVITPIIIVVLAIGLYFVNIPGIHANLSLINGLQTCQQGKYDISLAGYQKAISIGAYVGLSETREQALNCAVNVIASTAATADMKAKWFAFAQSLIKDQITTAPLETRGYYFGGSFFSQIGQWDMAIQYLEKALTLAPGKQNIQSSLAVAYLNSKQVEKGLALLKSVYESEHGSQDSSVQYAAALVFAGKEKEAEVLFPATSSVMTDDRVINMYDGKKEYEKVLRAYRIRAAAAPTDVQAQVLPIAVLYKMGRSYETISELRSLGVKFGETKTEVDKAIKAIQEGKNPFQ